MMQYGAMNFPVNPILDEIKMIAAMGFDYLELTMDPPYAHYSVIREYKEDILKALGACSLGLVCHLPSFVYTADFTESIRKASLDEMLNSIEVAAELGVSKAVLHPSMVSGLGIYVMDTVRKYAFQSLEAIAEKAEKKGICLCFENMFPNYGFFSEPEEFVEIFEKFPEFMLTLDIGHANIESKKSGKRILDFIEKLGTRIGHIHVSDNSGKKDEHLPVGKGTVPFPKIIRVLKKAGYQNTVTLEIFTEDRRHLLVSRDRFAAHV